MRPVLDVLIPTFQRPAALALTLAGLAGQSFKDFRVIISDQNDDLNVEEVEEVRAMIHVLRLHQNKVEVHKHLPRRGLAEHRHFLLGLVQAKYCMFLDDDIFLESYAVALMLKVLKEEGCAFTGNAVIGLSYAKDVRPDEQQFELWEGPVKPERVDPHSPAWQRHKLHNAANLLHVQQRLRVAPERPLRYKVAWIGGCSMYETARLREIGGYEFWKDLPPEHSGEDVMVQLRLLDRYGGCGIMPSGAYHLELPTTIPNREVDAPKVLPVNSPAPRPDEHPSNYSMV